MSMYFSSETYISSPTLDRTARIISRWASATPGEQVHSVIPLPTCAGVLGITRTTEP